MLLYPLWIPLLASMAVYVLGRIARKDVMPAVVSVFFLLSIFVVVLFFARFSGAVRLHGVGLFIAEISPPSTALIILAVALSFPFLLSCLKGLSAGRSTAVLTFLHMLLCASVACLICVEPFSLIISLEFVSFFFLAMMRAERARKAWSPIFSLLYFVPTILFLVALGETFGMGQDVEAVRIGPIQAVLLALAFGSRLLLMPLAMAAIRLAQFPSVRSATYGFPVLFFVVLFAMVRFLPSGTAIAPMIIGLAGVSALFCAALFYRESGVQRMVFLLFLEGSALVAGLAAFCSVRSPGLSHEPFILIGHAVCGLGVLLCGVYLVGEGRFVRISLLIFMLLFVGVPAAMSILLIGQGALMDVVFLPVAIAFISNLCLLGLFMDRFRSCQPKAKSDPLSTPVKAAIVLLFCYLIMPLLFFSHFRGYFRFIMSFVH